MDNRLLGYLTSATEKLYRRRSAGCRLIADGMGNCLTSSGCGGGSMGSRSEPCLPMVPVHGSSPVNRRRIHTGRHQETAQGKSRGGATRKEIPTERRRSCVVGLDSRTQKR